MHWWKVGKTNVEELLMKQTINEFDREMKMISKVGIRHNYFWERRTQRNNKHP